MRRSVYFSFFPMRRSFQHGQVGTDARGEPGGDTCRCCVRWCCVIWLHIRAVADARLSVRLCVCYKEEAPNNWYRQGTQKAGHTYNQHLFCVVMVCDGCCYLPFGMSGSSGWLNSYPRMSSCHVIIGAPRTQVYYMQTVDVDKFAPVRPRLFTLAKQLPLSNMQTTVIQSVTFQQP